jgi:Cys-tRNA(Pro)/Cys-tRNA(Cys) deacylase
MAINNVTRLLQAKKIPFQAFEFPPEKRSALETANLLGVSPEIVFKTIVVLREKPQKAVLAVIPGNHEVDLKLLASLLGEKKVHLPTQRDAETITGLQSGGISPLALLNKGFLIILDQKATNHSLMHISGGQRGLNIRLPVESFIALTNARLASISRETTSLSDE